MLITIEGPNGIGKTTTCKEVADRLRDKGYTVLVIAPKDNLFKGNVTGPNAFYFHLYNHVSFLDKIIENNPFCDILILDRWVESFLIYQGVLQNNYGYAKESVNNLLINFKHKGFKIGPIRSDMCFVLDAKVETVMENMANRNGEEVARSHALYIRKEVEAYRVAKLSCYTGELFRVNIDRIGASRDDIYDYITGHIDGGYVK